ncbi:glycoside hydrolase family 2 TIM barrel-domain containing protein [Microbacterium sp. SLBN-111]|uniref:glycoside hydrolase family 2 TIM barrel-domain containing protein n=1 Tax=Microbacterium sp. SLBN-111 TaxID=3377733 RepID=UPI003C7444A1
MIREPLLDGWTVGPKLGAFERRDAATAFVPVLLPHDALRDLPRDPASPQGVTSGYYPGGVFEYLRELDVPDEWREKTVLLEFEGVYRDAVVFVNGDRAAHEASGYAAFAVRLDPYLRFGRTNRITVEARVHKDSRWYTGAGIHRPVHLVVADPVHLALDATRVGTPDIDDERAIVAVSSTVENGTRHTRTVRVRWEVEGPDGEVVAVGDSPVSVLPGESAVARQRLLVRDPRRWGIDDPQLYRLRTTLLDEGRAEPLDEEAMAFGIRSLRLDPVHGLRINGETVTLRGACVHHDNGPLGAVALPAAEDRRVRLLKEAGFTAIRSSHNPASRALLDACDRHGMVVMDELGDVWTRAKSGFDHSVGFADHWRRDVEAMVAKDANHPSVVLYSIGNEILELGSAHGAVWSRRLAEAVRGLDDTRFVTNGINGIIANLDRMTEAMAEAEATDPNTLMATMGEQMALMNASELVTRSIEESAAVLDVVGFNYADSRYVLDAERFPNRVIVGSETFPERIGALWPLVSRLPHVIGDFTWTGWDYLGEAGIGRVDYTDAPGYVPTGTAGPYPYLAAESGDLDITGHRRTVSYFREIVYGLRTEPFLAVHPPRHHGRPVAVTPWSWDDSVASWTWDAASGAPVTVDVYADADEVELFLDGVSLGVAPVGTAREYTARFETAYVPGELVAIARRGGAEIGRTTLRTAAAEVALAARVEGDTLVTGPDALWFVPITLEDAAGIVPCDRDVRVTVHVDGPATLAGLGTGRAATEEPFSAASVTLFHGRALAIVRPTGAGDIRVRVSAEGYDHAEVVVRAY